MLNFCNFLLQVRLFFFSSSASSYNHVKCNNFYFISKWLLQQLHEACRGWIWPTSCLIFIVVVS
uniref:Uncharacterized protein n=1 Tax=Arundo donax TaxID=35708 RepID=A0A0A9G5W4_ARUDO